LSLLILQAAAAKDGHAVVSCSSLTRAGFKDTTITSARTIAAAESEKTPAYCEVTGVIAPVKGSQITVVYRLPVLSSTRSMR
jgi:hypothetical protein